MSALVIRLPMPPSVNECWRNVPRRGRVKTGKYITWSNQAAWIIKGLRPVTIDRPCSAAVELIGLRTIADGDNRVKPIFDALQAGGAVKNDNLIRSFWAGADDCIWRPTPEMLATVDFHIICEVER